MTIDEAIAFCYEKSSNIKLKAEPQVFIQLAEWLEELKFLKSEPIDCGSDVWKAYIYNLGRENGYNKALDDFVNFCEKQFTTMYGQRYVDMRDIVNIAEQLKEGGNIELSEHSKSQGD